MSDRATVSDLIKILQDLNISKEVRDDVAMDLGDSDEECAEEALIETGSPEEPSTTVASSCGTSLAEIWQRKGKKPDPDILSRLHPEAISEIKHVFR